MLPCADPLLDDESVVIRREKFRSSMRERLSTGINTKEVEELLNAAEAGNWSYIRRDQLNGIYCAVAVLRHAYRYVDMETLSISTGRLLTHYWKVGNYSCCQACTGRKSY